MAKVERHKAIVTRNIDDDQGLKLRGAVFFNAPTLFDGEFPLPAVPCFPFASDKGAGMFWVPKVNDEIEIEIEADDGSEDTIDIDLPEPRYTCMVYSDAADIDEIFKENYPNRMGWKTNSGHFLLFDDTPDKSFVSITSGKGHQIILDETKDLERIFFKTIKGNKFLIDDKNENFTIETVGGHKIILDDKNDKIQFIHKGGSTTVMEAGKITSTASAEIVADAPIIKLGTSPVFHATLSENVIGLHDQHLHLVPQSPGGINPSQPPIVPMSSKAGTPLDPTALSILLKGNT